MTHRAKAAAPERSADRYPTPAEVVASARQLAARFPGRCRLRSIGLSRAGRPIPLLSVGHGPRHVLVVAGPHPDEPVGGASALALARRVASGGHGSPATDPARVTWDIVLCLDPDGAALSGPAPDATPAGYYRTAFRPDAAHQPEWAPIAGGPLPETRALLRLIDEVRPVLQCSLHSTDAGGSWVQLTRELPGLAAEFADSAARRGIPVQHGTYDAPHWDNPAPGIFVLPARDAEGRLPRGTDDIGPTTWCAPQAYGGLTAIVEVPIWAAESAADPTPRADTGEVLRALSRLVRDGGARVTSVLDRAATFLPSGEDSAPRRVLDWMADDLFERVAASWEPPACGGAPLSTAQLTALEIAGRRQPLRAAGLLLRLLDASPDPAAPALRAELEHLFGTWCAEFEKVLLLRRVPVGRQVAHQAGTVVAAAACALGAGRQDLSPPDAGSTVA
ncbi:M14 family zinc carboxypeptidase [Streptomyces sp. VRA16 Mangrove soil]|uniref:M14 family zinc carboxypeptidase n=1 Tax=Streptomyces sp. VRA16 Mangrove soil TaxID=2817434 RepID=UPI001A9E51FD|nr:M14 family zinc carboxypeptidase [Streptomyces sp. VRA16 Mangrove soil]MBO1336913.1 hydroxylacyl-CoA dehydrogenase [Streptomyces sp. VRA16 Mangrove soil]